MRKFSRLIILVLSIVFLLKCATGNAPLRKNVEIDEDKYEDKEVVAFIGIEEKIGSLASSNKFCIRSWLFKENRGVMHQVYVNYSYVAEDWRTYKDAYSQEGQPLQLVFIEHDVNCDRIFYFYYETVGVTIADEYLRSHLNGFSITLSALSGDSLTIEVTPEQIKSQLIEIQEYKKWNDL